MQNREIECGEGIRAQNANWNFGAETAKEFSAHVAKSVPLYHEGHQLIEKLSDFFINPGSFCYELGTSTGSLLRRVALRHRHHAGVHWIGIDNEAAMIAQAQQESLEFPVNIEFIQDDIFFHPYQKADLIIAYYTVQFIPPRLRQDLLQKVYDALNWGGAFIMFEKVRAADARFQDYMSAMYLDYKLEQGYTPDEVVAKARSLKRVLEPFSSAANVDLLQRAGFQDVMSVMKYICFEGFLAIK